MTLEIELGVRPRMMVDGPLTFVVAADTHLIAAQPFAYDLAGAAADATALDPPPAFFAILGDITQGNTDPEFDLVDAQLAGLGVPYVPVPGNHDWYDGGTTWFRRYGPDNYSFDVAGVHFVVWNMAMSESTIRAYLGLELARVDRAMPVIALTHAPPAPPVLAALRDLGVDYVLTGHTHANRVADHDGLIELNTQPMLMGGLDFTPAGYRVLTMNVDRLQSYHRTVVDEPVLEIVAPKPEQCVPTTGGLLTVALELDASAAIAIARIDGTAPSVLQYAGGWSWQAELPALSPGEHAIVVEARAASGARRRRDAVITVCASIPLSPPVGSDWAQLGGSAAHLGSRPEPLSPPLSPRWTQSVGGHVLQGAPVIAGGVVFVTATDLGDGTSGGVIALELITGAIIWRRPTDVPIRGGPAIAGDLVAVAQLDGTILGLDARTGELRWRHELRVGVRSEAASIRAAPTIDNGDLLIGNQHAFAVIPAATGMPTWTVDPLGPIAFDFSTSGSIAVAGGLAIGSFSRGTGVTAWVRATGEVAWRVDPSSAPGVNGSPVIRGDTVYLVTAADDVLALDLATGEIRWRTRLDPAGFEWGNAIASAPAIALDTLVVPTLYGDLVAVDALSGTVIWRHAANPGALRTTHYRGSSMAGFAASPVIAGDIVWAVDTAGTLVALELRTGFELWRTTIGVPVLGGIALSGDWLVVTSYDGTVHALAAGVGPPPPQTLSNEAGCCDAGASGPGGPVVLTIIILLGFRRTRRLPCR